MTPETVARIRAVRAAALERGDLALVLECDLTLPLETCTPPAHEAAVPAKPRRPRKP